MLLLCLCVKHFVNFASSLSLADQTAYRWQPCDMVVRMAGETSQLIKPQ